MVTLHKFGCHPCTEGHANLLSIILILVYVLVKQAQSANLNDNKLGHQHGSVGEAVKYLPSAQGSGNGPGVLGLSLASGSPQGACFSLCLCLCLSCCVSRE